jgi:hypothetical protein
MAMNALTVLQRPATALINGKKVRSKIRRLDVHARQRTGHLARATMTVTESVAMDIALHPPGHDLGIAMMAVGMHNE